MQRNATGRVLAGLAALVGLAVLGMPVGPAHAAKEKFDRTKPHVNVGTIGHVDHGKTTLTAAIVKVLSGLGHPTFPPLLQVEQGAEQGAQGVMRRACDVEYETATRIYRHFDCPGREDFARDWLAGTAAVDDGAILVVSAADGPMPQTREHILLARQVGVPSLVVFLDEVDGVGPDALGRVEREVRELLLEHGFDPGLTPFLRGDIPGAFDGDPRHVAALLDLVDEMDLSIPQPVAAADKPFLMPVEDVFSIRGRGTVATGRVERGVVAEGDPLEIVGEVRARTAIVDMLLRRPPAAEEAGPGGNVGLLLRGIDRDEVERGQVLARPGSITPHRRFEAQIYVLEGQDGGGRHTPFFSGYRPQFYFRTTDVTGTVRLPPGLTQVPPGAHGTMEIELDEAAPLEQWQRFRVGSPRGSLGVGVVAEILD